ncbi:MAG: helix-turn-helix transcriptional regulator [Exilispira sp.]
MDKKNWLITIYWFFSYTVILTFLVITAIKALSKKKLEINHFIMILSSSLIMIGSTLYTLLAIENRVLEIICQIISISGVCLGIYGIPAFAFVVGNIEQKFSKLNFFLKIISLIFFIISIIVILTHKFIFIFFLVHIFFFITVAITSISGIIFSNKSKKNHENQRNEKISEKSKDNLFWENYLKNLGIISIFFVPVFIFFDLFGGFNIGPLLKLSNAGFRFFPFFFISWAIIYFYQLFKSNPVFSLSVSTKFLTAKEEDLNLKINYDIDIILSSDKISDFGLSQREKEVLNLLLKGLSYKQIASQLSISMATAKTHIARIYEKTQTNSKIELMNKLLNRSK